MLSLDQSGARPGEVAFFILRKRVRQTYAYQEVQHGITQELEPLIIAYSARIFAGVRGMGQSLQEQVPTPKLIANVGLETCEGSLSHASKKELGQSQRDGAIRKP